MKKYILILCAVVGISLVSCEYDFYEGFTPPPPGGGDDPVLFQDQIQPIFTSKCTTCHGTGGQSPDLSDGNAYTSIMNGYVTAGDPEESKIYYYIAPDTSTHSRRKYSNEEASLVYLWISQGAEDN